MKIGVITIHFYDNYGAILQCYALQKTLEKLGADVEVFNYECDYIKRPYTWIHKKNKGFMRYLFELIGYVCYLPRRRGFQKFRQNIRFSAPIYKEGLKEASKEYDALIAGSDQIWNFRNTGFETAYFLDFVEKPVKKYSYAASFGVNELDADTMAQCKELLASFSGISVREESAVPLIEDITGRMPAKVLDPTLLLDQETWEELCKPPKAQEPFILVYQLGFSKNLIAFAKKLAKEKHMKIQYIPFPLGGGVKCHCNIAPSPEEWLGLFKQASYVVSDSFHGIVFSVAFEKEFFVEADGQHKNIRARELVELLKLDNRRIINGENASSNQKINYQKVHQILQKEKDVSLHYLQNIVNQIET